jgi:hypothetical protein
MISGCEALPVARYCGDVPQNGQGNGEQGAGAQLPPRVSDSLLIGSLIVSVPTTPAVGQQWLSLAVGPFPPRKCETDSNTTNELGNQLEPPMTTKRLGLLKQITFFGGILCTFIGVSRNWARGGDLVSAGLSCGGLLMTCCGQFVGVAIGKRQAKESAGEKEALRALQHEMETLKRGDWLVNK